MRLPHMRYRPKTRTIDTCQPKRFTLRLFAKQLSALATVH